jgi:polyhydroxybutyrate depolymerase
VIPRRISPPDEERGTAEHVVTHDGRPRRYRIHIPPVVPPAAALVVQLHGGGGNGTGLDRLTRFHRLADRERCVVLSPSGFDRHWNDGRSPTVAGVDDVGFLVALVEGAAGRLPIDRRRIYVVGISNGAMMAARLAHEVPDHFAAFGQVAGTAPEDATEWWQPSRPVPIIQIHGTADPILPYEGGAVLRRRPGAEDPGRVLGVDQWAALVAGHNRAGGPTVERIPPDVTVRRWAGPSASGDVEFWQVAGGGHTWPGGIQYLPERTIGTTSATFDATAALWRFFAAHALP